MLNNEGFIVSKSAARTQRPLIKLERAFKHVDFYTEEELLLVPAGSCFAFDVECYVNYWCVGFKNVETGKCILFKNSPDNDLNVNKLMWALWRFCIIGFNSINYDLPLCILAAKGLGTEQLKAISDRIILEGLRVWDLEKEYKIKIPNLNHIDIMEVAPLSASLKMYVGRLHCERMQDLPIPPDAVLTQHEGGLIEQYNLASDLPNTILLYKELLPAIVLREEMGKQYKIELRSKSDAQVAEAVVNAEIKKITGSKPPKPPRKNYGGLKYNIPAYVKYQCPHLNKMLADLQKAEFFLNKKGEPMWPKGLGEKEETKDGEEKWILKVRVGNNIYKMGMGGLHSQEKNVCHVADDDTIISDDDVESFYPRIIINQQLYPEHIGPIFLKVYEHLVNTRIAAKKSAETCKKAGDKSGAKYWKLIADSLKITINGLFGKLGSNYSTVFAPQLMLQVTITGQLSLLMLIEMLELAGIPCISGNTDGVVTKYKKAQQETQSAIIKEWEKITNFKTENTRYYGVYSRDVNNYIAIKINDKGEIDEVKTKGVYSERGSAGNSVLSKNPESLIVSEAVQEFIKNKTPIDEFIKSATDIKKFLSVRTVKGGAQKNGVYLGKAVRWYFAKNEAGCINYIMSGNKVPKSDGAKPLMDLPDDFPVDIDYDYYIREANDALFDVGIYKKASTIPMFF